MAIDAGIESMGIDTGRDVKCVRHHNQCRGLLTSGECRVVYSVAKRLEHRGTRARWWERGRGLWCVTGYVCLIVHIQQR
jgi:hypothetical protein